jgi:hypothetical protein
MDSAGRFQTDGFDAVLRVTQADLVHSSPPRRSQKYRSRPPPRRAGRALSSKVTGPETEKSIDFKSLIDLKFFGRV